MVIKGQLVPEDGTEGCKFTIDTAKYPEMVDVELTSPYSGEKLAGALLELKDVSEWLYNKRDW